MEQHEAPSPHTGAHVHVWHLPDGTGLHAPVGQLLVEEGTGRLCCHLCGGWFRSLGSHVRAHGHTAESYRSELGLCRGDSLTQQDLSRAISERQRAAYLDDETFRERFAEGQRSARDGALSRTAAEAREREPLSTGALARQADALRSGRATAAARRDAALRTVLAAAGSPDLATYLRTRYEEGASLSQLAADTGLGRARLRAEVAAAGIVVRPRGENTSGGKRSRAAAAEAAAAARVGTEDLVGWLRARRADGWTLTRLGAAVGHSSHWVRWRLEGDRAPSGSVG